MRDYNRHTWARTSAGAEAPLPPLTPYPRCNCGKCQECISNAKWDSVFAKFEVREEDNWETKGLFQSTLRGW